MCVHLCICCKLGKLLDRQVITALYSLQRYFLQDDPILSKLDMKIALSLCVQALGFVWQEVISQADVRKRKWYSVSLIIRMLARLGRTRRRLLRCWSSHHDWVNFLTVGIIGIVVVAGVAAITVGAA